MESTLLEIDCMLDSPTLQDAEKELARAFQYLGTARETLIGAHLLLSQCEPRQITRENAISCALGLLAKVEGLADVVRGEIALELTGEARRDTTHAKET